MKGLFLVLILTSFFIMLVAQTTPYQEQIDRSRMILSSDPNDNTERLNLAYYLMLSGFPELALPEYRQVLSSDSLNTNAAAGTLWALNNLGKWRQSANEAVGFISAHPEAGLLYHYRAEALLRLRYPFRARHLYVQAIHKLNDPLLLQLAEKSLSDTYSALGDYPRSAAWLKHTANANINNMQGRTQLAQTHTLAELSYARKDSTTTAIGAALTLKKRSLSYRLGFENLRFNGENIRWTAQAGLTKQFLPLDVAISAKFLDGKDDRIYRAVAGSIVLTPKIYLGSLLLKPRLAQNVSSFRRFNVYQSDLGIGLDLDLFGVAYNASYVYQDNEAASTDTTRYVHSLSAYLRLFKDSYLGLYAGSGDLAWYTNAAGSVVDDFEPVSSYLGASLSVPLLQKLALTIYYQYGTRKDVPSHFISARVSFSA